VTRDVQDSAPVEVAILEARLVSPIDTENRLTLNKAIAELRTINPRLHIVISTPSPMAASEFDGHEVDVLVEIEQKRAATNLATHLGLSLFEDVGVILALTGLQGGVGRSYIARNLAQVYAQAFPAGRDGKGGVLLWEMDLHHPTIGFLRNFTPAILDHGRRTIAGLLNADTTLLEGSNESAMSAISPYIISSNENPVGCDVLLAPHGLRETIAIYQAYPDLPELQRRLGAILEIVSRHYKVIVLDTGYDLFADPGATLALDRADVVVPVVAPGPAGLSAVMGLGVLIGDKSLRSRTQLIFNTGVRNENDYQSYMRDEAAKTMSDPIVLGSDPDYKVWRELADRLLKMRK
jgi:MinD-like ATPase involved in chromosome partitioning or flagellar assembly